MTLMDFARKAAEGGYTGRAIAAQDGKLHSYTTDILLQADAWKAVGKVEGWEALEQFMWNGKPLYWKGDNQHIYTPHLPLWHLNWHRMIDALAAGLSIEQYLETL